MKKIILLSAFALMACTSMAQKVTKDSNGNYVAVSRSDTSQNKATGHTFLDTKGNQYPVYISAKGKLFYNKVSAKTGKPYKVYFKEN